MSNYKNYQIVYLNGPSSSGKTTLARALQARLSKPFLVFGLDQMIYMMPEKTNDWTHGTNAPGFSWHLVQDHHGKQALRVVAGHFGNKIVQSLKAVTVTLATSGHYLIIDDVSFGKHEVDAWREALQAFTVLWVGVTASLEIIEAREKARGDRRIGGARWQAEHVHANVIYDLMVDTSHNNAQADAELIYQHLYRDQ